MDSEPLKAQNNNQARSKRGWLLALALIVLLGGAALAYFMSRPKVPHYQKLPVKDHRTKRVNITGEVVDAWCYASQTMGPGRGENHKACALACSYGGVTMGILEDGSKDLYIAAKSNKPYKGCNDLLIPFIAQKVKVTGWVGNLGGCRVLKIDTVTPLSAESTTGEATAGDNNSNQRPEEK